MISFSELPVRETFRVKPHGNNDETAAWLESPYIQVEVPTVYFDTENVSDEAANAMKYANSLLESIETYGSSVSWFRDLALLEIESKLGERRVFIRFTSPLVRTATSGDVKQLCYDEIINALKLAADGRIAHVQII